MKKIGNCWSIHIPTSPKEPELCWELNKHNQEPIEMPDALSSDFFSHISVTFLSPGQFSVIPEAPSD